LISSKQEHLGHYFPPPQHRFAPQEHPTAFTKAQDKHFANLLLENIQQLLQKLKINILI
jgi:hypothetical protein